MKGIILWLSLGIFLISGITLLKWQQSEATDYSGSTIPANGTSVVIEEEKEEDEINATTTSADIKTEQLLIPARSNKTIIYVNSMQEYNLAEKHHKLDLNRSLFVVCLDVTS